MKFTYPFPTFLDLGKLAFYCSLLLLLSGCLLLNTDRRMSAEHAQFVKTVGVISLLDPHPRLHFAAQEPKDIVDRIGIIKSWEINKVIQGVVGDRLRAKGFTVKPITAPDSLKAVYTSSWSTAKPELIHDQLYALGQQHGVDVVVTVYRHRDSDFISDSIDNLRGYGIFRSHRIDPHIYATVYVEAIDVKKQFIVGQASANQAKPFDAGIWHEEFGQGKGPVLLTANVSDPIAEELKDLITLATVIAAREAGVSN